MYIRGPKLGEIYFVMAKWDKRKFIKKTKSDCISHVSMIMMDLIKFAEENADQIVWGSGDQYGTMTFKCKSIDYGSCSCLCVLIDSVRNLFRRSPWTP